MKKGLTEFIFILDRSGSMAGLESDTIGGFNAMIAKQRKNKKDVLVSTILFNQESEVVHDRKNIQDITPLTEEIYSVSGCTALADAIGCAIHHIRNIHKYVRAEDVPEHTLFVITTDGLENASHRYDSTTVKSMIKEEQTEHGWKFLFLGANIDAVETAKIFGIHSQYAANYVNDASGIERNFTIVGAVCETFSKSGAIPSNWKNDRKQNFSVRQKAK